MVEKKFEALTMDAIEKAKDMSVDELTQLFKEDKVSDVELKNRVAEQSAAHQAFMKTSKGLGRAINELLLENEDLQKKWTDVIKNLAQMKDSAGDDFSRKTATSSWIPGFLRKRAKKSLEKKIDTNILEVLPNLLQSQWVITEKASNRVDAQKILLKQSQGEAEQYFKDLADDMKKFRGEVQKKREEFDKGRVKLTEIEAILKENSELEILLDEGKVLPEGKVILVEKDYNDLVTERTKLVDMDNDRDLALQTVIQQLRASKDGYKMTEMQIGQLSTTLKSLSSISTMLKSFLKVTRPIMMRSITILNAEREGIRAANLLYALSESMNATLKMCAYGMTHMTEQAVMLGNKDFLENATVEEVKRIQDANDKIWKEFTDKQYQNVLAKVKPIMEHMMDAGSTEKQEV